MSALKTLARSVFPASMVDGARDALWRLLGVRGMLPSGLPLEVRSLSDWVVFRDIFVNGEYDEAIAYAFDSLRDEECARILDLGANVGFFALRCLDLAARRGLPWDRVDLTLVEGNPEVFAELERRTDAWGATAAHALALRHGLAGLLEGVGSMRAAGLNCMNHVAPPGARGDSAAVPYIDLRGVLEGGPVHLLKCDIEGSEEDFLASYAAHLANVRAVVIELHHDRCDTARCTRVLESAGLGKRRILREEPTFAVAFFHR